MIGNSQGRLQDRRPLSVIDIGSNSIRLVIYEGIARSPTVLFNEKMLAGLGRGLVTTGKLDPEAVTRAVDEFRRFRALSEQAGATRLHVIATAAAREAQNGADFIHRAEDILGVPIRVLSGREEAYYSALGVISGFHPADGIAGDLGGGSLELIDINPATISNASTLPLGGLRLIDQTGNKIERALPIVDEAIAKTEWLMSGRGRPFFAVGGTWRALAKLHMVQLNYPLRVMQGYAVSTREMIEFCQFIRRHKKLATMPGMEEVARARREVVPFGALVLERLLEAMAPSEVVLSVYGIREGLLYSLMTRHEQAKDPLLCFCEDYARLRSRSVVHAHELCVWTDALFEGDGPKETPEERRLRYAACLLSDIGWRAHPDYRGEQSLNVIAHAGLSGIDHPGRIFLALAVYHRHVGSDEGASIDALSTRLRAAISKRAQKRARIIGAAVRTAHMLSIGMPGVIDETQLSHEGTTLVLTLPKSYAALDGERLRRRFGVLAALLSREPEIRIAK
jgi:exopolyphosphatase/guanosine-5'-triphosphate,3'-diphosphate pyrophosphatase